MDASYSNPSNQAFTYITILACIGICAYGLVIFLTQPFKLNRTDYDFGRRSTMVNSYSKKEMYKAGKQNATAINSLLEDEDEVVRMASDRISNNVWCLLT